MTRDARFRPDPWLWLILATGLALRLLYFSAPYGDAHRWRQIENLAVAWNFTESSLNPLYPQAIWGGLRNAYVEMELPFVPFVLAVAWRLFGFHEALGRVVGIVSSLVAIWALYHVGRQLFDRAVGRAAALLLAISPSAVFFGRVPMTDMPMLACSTLAVLGYLRYFDGAGRAWAAVGAAAAMGAWLLKIPSLLILGPIAMIAWQARGWRMLADRRFLGGLALAALATIAWYVHAWRLYEATGWTVGIWRPFGQYPAQIAAASGTPGAFSLWSSRALLTDADFYARLLDRLWYIHLTPLGLTGVLFGLLRAVSLRRGLVVLSWFGAVCAFILVVGAGNYWHEYYQLPLLPPAALLFGLAAAPFFSGASAAAANRDTREQAVDAVAGRAGRAWWHARLDAVARPVLIVALALASFHYSGIVRNFFRPETQDWLSIETGKAITNHIPRGDGLIVVEYDQGTNSPVLLYFARRRGWSFDLTTISPQVIEHLKSEGATHFATTIFPLLEDKRPDMVEYLRLHRQVPLGDRAPHDARLFELN